MSKHDAVKLVVKLAASYGFKLVRQKKHLVFKHPCGATLVTSATCGDWRIVKKVETNIKHILLNHDSNHSG